MLKKDVPAQQMVYYQAGIGTYTIPQIAKPMMAKLHKIMDSMVGVHLNAHVMGTYHSFVIFPFRPSMFCRVGMCRCCGTWVTALFCVFGKAL